MKLTPDAYLGRPAGHCCTARLSGSVIIVYFVAASLVWQADGVKPRL